MNIVVLGPQIEPLTRDEVKLYRRIETAADDGLVDAMIAAARQACEHRTQRTLIETTRATILDEFPSAIRLAFPPALAVESVKYIDVDGIEQTLAPSAYVLDPDTLPGYVVPAYDTEWPEARRGQIRSVRVQYTTGYFAGGTDAQKRAAVPASLRMWMQLAIGEMYELREATITGTIASKLAFADSLLEEHVVSLML